MQSLECLGQAQRFTSTHSAVDNTFNTQRHLVSRNHHASTPILDHGGVAQRVDRCSMNFRVSGSARPWDVNLTTDPPNVAPKGSRRRRPLPRWKRIGTCKPANAGAFGAIPQDGDWCWDCVAETESA